MRRLADVHVAAEADPDAVRPVAGLGADPLVVADLRREFGRRQRDVGERQRQAEARRARRVLGVAAGADPDRQRRPAPAAAKSRASSSGGRKRPCQVTRSDGASLRRSSSFSVEQRIVVVEAAAEEREGFEERAAAGDDLGPAAGDEIDRGEILEDADRIEGREDRHRAATRMRLVRAATAAITTAGDEMAMSRRWCSPKAKTARPAWSASSAAARISAIALLDADHPAGRRVGGDVGEGVEADFHAVRPPHDPRRRSPRGRWGR